MSDRTVCLVHGIPDCSPMLNGCSLVTDLEKVSVKVSPRPIRGSGNIVKIGLSMAQSEVDNIDRWATPRGLSRAAAARALIEIALGAETGDNS